MTEKKTCPLFCAMTPYEDYACLRTACAWWDHVSMACAILGIAIQLQNKLDCIASVIEEK